MARADPRPRRADFQAIDDKRLSSLLSQARWISSTEYASLMRSCAKPIAIAATGSSGVAGARAMMMVLIITPTSKAGRTRAG
jgi:hypothetical protein